MLFLLSFYFFLLSATCLIAYNTYKMWRLNKDFTLVISIFFIYYFTLGGAWIFPLDAYSGFKGIEIGLHYLPIFDKLFKVAFDFNYLYACTLYVLFILSFQYTYLFGMKKWVSVNVNLIPRKEKYVINTLYVAILSVVLVLISFYVLRKEIFYAIATEKSIYLVTRANTNKYYTFHQLANEFSVIVPFIAFSFASLKTNKYNIEIKQAKWSFYLLLFACIFSSLYIAFIGNRREILSGIVICLLIALNERKNIYPKKVGIILSIVFIIFLSNNFFRSTTIPIFLNKLLSPKTEHVVLKQEDPGAGESSMLKTKQALGSLILSNELFYAHFSMYGVIHKKVPLTYGSSVLSLAGSLVPRSLYPQRPPDIYSYYAESVHAVPGQIYTIHHTTAWYLNFGFFGVLLGAVILASVYIAAFKIQQLPDKWNNKFITLLKFLMPFLVCSQIVTFITAGPEAYKAMIIEGIIIPIILLGLSTKKFEQKRK